MIFVSPKHGQGMTDFVSIRRFVNIYVHVIDNLCLFWFSGKIPHANISGRQNKNKLKEEHVESNEQA